MSPAPPPYAELHCRSNYTFLVGASEPEELVERAAAKLYTAIALTDECSVSGVVRAHLAVRVGQPVSRGGNDLQPNGEAYLRVRAYLRQAFLDASMR